MPKLKERPLADFLRSPASDAQLLELWSKIEDGQARRLTRSRQLRLGAGVAGVGIFVGALALAGSFEPAPVALDRAAVEPAASAPSAASDAPQQLSLADGSQLMLSRGTRARVLAMRADEVRVRLEHAPTTEDLRTPVCSVDARRPRGGRPVVAAGDGQQPVAPARGIARLRLHHPFVAARTRGVRGVRGVPSGPRVSVVNVAQSRRRTRTGWR
jgi:hypothetical protein